MINFRGKSGNSDHNVIFVLCRESFSPLRKPQVTGSLGQKSHLKNEFHQRFIDLFPKRKGFFDVWRHHH